MKELLPKSFLDTDFYKLTMLQFLWKTGRYHKEGRFTFNERSRSKYPIPNRVYEKAVFELNEWRKTEYAKPQIEDIEYLQTLSDDDFKPLFENEFLSFLSTEWNLPELELTFKSEEPHLSVTGKWGDIMMWEIYVLSTISAYYYFDKDPTYFIQASERVAVETFNAKISKYQDINEKENLRYKIAEFGTRRRFSFATQYRILKQFEQIHRKNARFSSNLTSNITLAGTSNVHLARELMLNPIGTFAHELPMGHVGSKTSELKFGNIDYNYKVYREVFDEWAKVYPSLTIALTDTYGSKKFFEHDVITPDEWKGVRHDSGDPIEFTKMVIAWLERHNWSEKFTIVFSDGLDFEKMRIILKFTEHFENLNVLFGVGTNLTNDHPDLNTLSIVMKLTSIEDDSKPSSDTALWSDTVKLSDNLAKATDSNYMLDYKEYFGHTHDNYKETKV